MRAPVLSLFALMLCAGAGGARAGEMACWYEHGALVVAAAAGNISGDFILDTAAPRSQIHLTRAQAEGYDTGHVVLALRLAGDRIGPLDFQVADLDARGWGFPTDINGVIGDDALAGAVLDIRYSPCRVSLWRGRAPAFRAARTLPMRMIGGAPTVAASVSDRVGVLSGRFVVDTGSAGVRISADDAAFSRISLSADPLLRTSAAARLRALRLDGEVLENLPANLQIDAPAGTLGSIGNPVWARWAVRLDFRRGRLELAPSPSWGGSAQRSEAGVGMSGDGR